MRLPHHALVMQFVAALLQRTLDCPTAEAHQQALQGFLDALTPWINPVELPTLLAQPFTLFDRLAFTPHGDGDDEDVSWHCPRAGRSCSALGCASGAWTRWCAAPEKRIMPRPPTQEPRPPPTAIPTADASDAPLTPSKSQRKRDAHAL